VLESFVRSPQKLTDRTSRKLQLPPSTVWPILCKCLRAKGYRLHTLDNFDRWPRPACSFRSSQAATLLEFLVPLTNCLLPVGGSVWYLVRNLRGTVITDSVLPNSKTENVFLSLVPAMFRHYCSPAVKPSSTPWRLLPKQTWKDYLPIDLLLSAVSFLFVALPNSKLPAGLMNYSVYTCTNTPSYCNYVIGYSVIYWITGLHVCHQVHPTLASKYVYI
jgi:hypothetical protein